MSIGDRVRYNCGAIGEIIDFDKDGADMLIWACSSWLYSLLFQ